MTNREVNQEKQEVSDTFLSMWDPKNIFAVLGVGLFIGFLAPFGMDQLNPYLTISYWVVTCAVGYAIYFPTILIINKKFTQTVKKQWLRIAIGSLLASILMSFIIPIITLVFFDQAINWLMQLRGIFPKTVMIGAVITLLNVMQNYIYQQKQQLAESKIALEQSEQNTQLIANQAAKDFLLQLPIEKRGKLLCLEMSDHYLNVHTDKGQHLLLMRFKDALTALNEYPGMQTHRSWWVAHDAITKVEKNGRKIQLCLSNDIIAPVSRTFIDEVKGAGFAE